MLSCVEGWWAGRLQLAGRGSTRWGGIRGGFWVYVCQSVCQGPRKVEGSGLVRDDGSGWQAVALPILKQYQVRCVWGGAFCSRPRAWGFQGLGAPGPAWGAGVWGPSGQALSTVAPATPPPKPPCKPSTPPAQPQHPPPPQTPPHHTPRDANTFMQPPTTPTYPPSTPPFPCATPTPPFPCSAPLSRSLLTAAGSRRRSRGWCGTTGTQTPTLGTGRRVGGGRKGRFGVCWGRCGVLGWCGATSTSPRLWELAGALEGGVRSRPPVGVFVGGDAGWWPAPKPPKRSACKTIPAAIEARATPNPKQPNPTHTPSAPNRKPKLQPITGQGADRPPGGRA